MSKNISLIPFNCGWGAQVRGCSDGPKFLKDRGLAEYLNDANLPVKFSWAEFKTSSLESDLSEDAAEKLSCADAFPLVVDYCEILNDQVKSCLAEGNFPVSIGGDHSMAVGTWAAVAEHYDVAGQLGLIWIDAHLDSNTPETSPSDAYHGMPAAVLLGHGREEFKNVGYESPIIRPENICFIGIRSFEKGEESLLQDLGVKIFYMEEVEKLGMEEVMRQALAIAKNGTKGFGVTIDLDAFDPDRAPGVGSPEEGGLLRGDSFAALKSIAHDESILGLEITEYNPYLGEEMKTTNLVKDLMLNIFSDK